MLAPSIRILDDLSTKELKLLAQLLSITPRTIPSTGWLKDQQTCVAKLPSKLRRPDSLIPCITMALSFTQKARLCRSHRRLNAHLIRRIFLQVSAECTTRLTRLVENPYLSISVAEFVKRLHTINSLWMSPDLYRATFQCMPNEERFERLPTDCEACILAAVGGNHQILSDLRSSMLGRKTKRGPEARLLKLVEEWIEWTGMENALRAVSDTTSKNVRACRRQMQMARRQKRQNLANGIVEGEDTNEPKLQHDAAADAHEDEWQKDHEKRQGEERDEYDPEASIINFYAQGMSSLAPTLNEEQREGSIHPAFYNSSSQSSSPNTPRSNLPLRPGNPTAYSEIEPSVRGRRGASARQHQPPPAAYNNRRQRRNTVYSESVYSRPEGKGRFDASSTRLDLNVKLPKKTKSSEEQAGEYRGLLHVEDDVSQIGNWEAVEDVEDDCKPGQHRMTSFEDFM